MTDPLWLAKARTYVNLKEFPGTATNPTIKGWLQALSAAWHDDSTPWCGVFVAEMFRETGFSPVKGWAWAKAWLNFGVPLKEPALGCVVVFGRIGGGHVSFCVGKDKSGNIICLGGNQSDAVDIKPFNTARVLGYRWPANVALPTGPLPLLDSTGKVSTNEA